MAEGGFKLELIGFDKLLDIFDPAKAPARLRRHVRAATQRNALLATSEVQRAIYKGVPPPDSALTVALKGSSRPLVDTGSLASSVSGKATDWNEATISVNRRARKRTKMGKGKRQPATSMADVAAILYYGASVKVTPKMRRLFFALSREASRKSRKKKSPTAGMEFKPLKATTKVIVIPPRKFMDAAVAPAMAAKYQDNWAAAVRLFLAGVD